MTPSHRGLWPRDWDSPGRVVWRIVWWTPTVAVGALLVLLLTVKELQPLSQSYKEVFR